MKSRDKLVTVYHGTDSSDFACIPKGKQVTDSLEDASVWARATNAPNPQGWVYTLRVRPNDLKALPPKPEFDNRHWELRRDIPITVPPSPVPPHR